MEIREVYMKVSEKFFRDSIITCIKSACVKIREIDATTYPINDETRKINGAIWRLSRDASLILENVLEGLEHTCSDEDD